MRSRGAGPLTATPGPHGPPPYVATARAAAQPVSSNPGAVQFAGAVCDAFHAASVTTVVPPATVSLATTPAGDCVVFSAATATVLVPAASRPRRSTTVARRHESVTRDDVLTATPLTHTSAVSSPVTTSCPDAGATGRLNVRRK